MAGGFKKEAIVDRRGLFCSEIGLRTSSLAARIYLDREPTSRERDKFLTSSSYAIESVTDKFIEDLTNHLAERMVIESFSPGNPRQASEWIKGTLDRWRNQGA